MPSPSTAASAPAGDPVPRYRFLPPIGTPAYYVLLSAVAILVLGPLGGITAAYMNFSLGFFVGGQVLAGILGSAVTYGYGAHGKHGANYMQTMAASVASMGAMAVLIQAMVWLGMPMPDAWRVVVYFTCIGMFGVGVGMLYTPLLVDRMRLTYPSGFAVANILRALTDPRLLRRSIGQLGGGMGLGALAAVLTEKVARIGALGISGSTLGAGMIVASRIAVPGLVMGLVGQAMTPWLRANEWLGPKDPFRKIGFLVGLAMILGAALVDITLILIQAARRLKEGRAADQAPPQEAWKRTDTRKLLAWVAFWAVAVVASATLLLGQAPGFVIFALVLSLVFVLVNGISLGISDSNPISSAFVVSVMLMSLLGLTDGVAGIMAASVLLIATSVGCDMQQDRSTGWRLGTNRTLQFRFQVVGIVMGAVLAVVLARTFLGAYPVLAVNSFAHPDQDVGQWQSAMTYKFVGAITDLGHLPTYKAVALAIGLGFGAVTEAARKLLHRSAAWRRLTSKGEKGFAAGWVMDSILLSSPYALSFGGFVELMTTVWFAAGGALTSALNTLGARFRPPAAGNDDLPEDMSTTSLVGGGLIAGEALFFLGLGIIGLLTLVS